MAPRERFLISRIADFIFPPPLNIQY